MKPCAHGDAVRKARGECRNNQDKVMSQSGHSVRNGSSKGETSERKRVAED